MRRINTGFFLSLALNIVLLAFIVLYIYRNYDRFWQKCITLTGGPDVVMFGDSHTANGNWTFRVNGFSITGIGYPGFTSGQLRNMMMTKVLRFEPEFCFIQAGGNDINSDCYSEDTVLANLLIMVDSLKAHASNPVVQSLFYRLNDSLYNKEVDSINKRIRQQATEKSFEYLEINAFLSGGNGKLENFYIDGIHLNHEGYGIWSDRVKEFLSNRE